MDLYRFFHPHHNPRLRQKALRHQEISELELAAKELLLALKRASLRLNSTDSNSTENSAYIDLLEPAINATELATDFLGSLTEEFPEDKKSDFINLLKERKNAPGWEAWTRLLYERLFIIYKGNINNDCSPLNTNNEDPSVDPDIKIKVNG